MDQDVHALGDFCHSKNLNSCHMSEYKKLLNMCMFLVGFVHLGFFFNIVTE